MSRQSNQTLRTGSNRRLSSNSPNVAKSKKFNPNTDVSREESEEAFEKWILRGSNEGRARIPSKDSQDMQQRLTVIHDSIRSLMEALQAPDSALVLPKKRVNDTGVGPGTPDARKSAKLRESKTDKKKFTPPPNKMPVRKKDSTSFPRYLSMTSFEKEMK